MFNCPVKFFFGGMLCFFVLCPGQLLAGEEARNSRAVNPTLPIMPEVVVAGERIAPTTGTTIIDRQMISTLPAATGSINEIIGIVPGVIYNEDYQNSSTAGELTPPSISISGSRFYDNNYTLDGISNNDLIDPAQQSVEQVSKLPGHPQTHFISPRLVEEITVYNSNIPAEFGGFTGGQVDVETLSPEYRLGGSISYRTTSDAWTNFHIDRQERDSFANSDHHDQQPEFRKHDFGLIFNIPVNFDTALVASYQQLYSEIPLHHLDGHDTQTRRNENLFFKLEHLLNDNSQLTLSALYSPTSGDYFLQETKGSSYSLEKDSYSLALDYEKALESAELSLRLGYTRQNSQREAANLRFLWDPDTPSIDWASGREGSLGPLSTKQTTISFKPSLTFAPLDTGPLNHQLKIGGDLSYSKLDYRRSSSSYFYYLPQLSAELVCGPDDPGCIDQEQYFSRRTAYPETHNSADLTDYALYVQDAIAWQRLELFPGIRLSYDNFTHNYNVAPRFSASLDLFGNRRTVLFFGRNRYFSGTILNHKLYSSIETINQTRDSPLASWAGSPSFSYAENNIDTPYSDETTAGLIQNFLGGELKLQYLVKDSYREFARERTLMDGSYVYVYNNLGRSEYESINASWRRSWSEHAFEINASWQDIASSHTDYETTFDSEDADSTIWYRGEEIYPHEEPRKDFNRPLIVNLIYRCRLPYGLTFANKARYRGPYERLMVLRDENNRLVRRQSVVNPEQGEVLVYRKVKTHSSILFDWRLTWQVPKQSSRNMVFVLDVLNVFDKRSKLGYQSSPPYQYTIGRQIWAGLTFNF